MYRLVVCSCICFSLAMPVLAGEVPEALRKAHEKRMDFKTAKLEFRRTLKVPGMANRIRNCEAQLAGESLLLIDKGDDDGIGSRDPRTGEPSFGVADTCLPVRMVFDADAQQYWYLRGSEISVGVFNEGWQEPLGDIRSFGLFARDIQGKTPREMLDVTEKADLRWTVEVMEGDTVRVTGADRQKPGSEYHREYVWEIDPTRDYAVTRCVEYQVARDGSRSLLAELNAEYSFNDGRWWPRHVDSICPSTGWHASVEYKHAEFDRENHPNKINVDILGIPIGTRVSGPATEPGPMPAGRYVGAGQIIPEDQWGDFKDDYDMGPHKAFIAHQNSLEHGFYPAWWQAGEADYGIEDVAFKPDAWEAYVRRWIIKHSNGHDYKVPEPLSTRQIEAAWGILRDSRRKAEPIRKRVDEEVKAASERVRLLQQSLDQQRKASAGDKVQDGESAEAKRLQAAEKRLSEMKQPRELERLFGRLRQRLESILSSSQPLKDSLPEASSRPSKPD